MGGFRATVLDYYHRQGRHDLPWRVPQQDGAFDPYTILVSELMLQQTQVSRVIPKFELFTEAFPSFESLAVAPLADVLALWSGLGYNRRAKFLLQTARLVVSQYRGRLPRDTAGLLALPGIGRNTAGAIQAYAFDEPAVFIETNIRTVFIHHFFADHDIVDDKALTPLIAESLAGQSPRTWYWALMDYGTHLKQQVGNASRRSASYTKQSAFEGSRRQLRGMLLRILAGGPQSVAGLHTAIADDRLDSVLHDMLTEGFIECNADHYQLSS